MASNVIAKPKAVEPSQATVNKIPPYTRFVMGGFSG